MKPRVQIRHAVSDDAKDWLGLRCALWPEGPESEHRDEIRDFFAGTAAEPTAVLLAYSDSGGAIGLAELSVRAYAEGCTRHGVAYLEGWFVAPEWRGTGVGRQLVTAAEEWGRQQGCSEFASDAALDNDPSRQAHLALGFREAGVIRCFIKKL